MGKRVVAGLFALTAVFLVRAPGGAQEVEKPQPEGNAAGFEPGGFLTEGDFEHVNQALGYLNLRPEDLNYEKKHLDHRFRLEVMNRSLDQPLTLPKTAETSSRAFGVSSSATQRCVRAAELLDIGPARWTADELQKDGEQVKKLFDRRQELVDKQRKAEDAGDDSLAKDLQDQIDAVDDEINVLEEASIFGEFPSALIEDERIEDWGRSRCPVKPTAASRALTRKGWRLRPEDANALGYSVAELVAESEIHIPGTVESEPEDLFELGGRSHLDGILVAGSRLSTLLAQYAGGNLHAWRLQPEWAAGTPDHEVAGVTGNVVSAWQSKWGKVVIGGSGPNTYEGDDFIGIIDLGGNDTYRGRVACGIGLEGQAPLSFVIDLHGDDRYLGEDFTQGFGFLGVGILHDYGGGDDFYKSRFCAQGCGLCGYGELYDDGGDDHYETDSGSQGAGVFGYGQLTDKAGNDTYRGCRFTQGFAQVMGVGVLTDGGGNDLYYAGGKYLHEPLFNDRYQSLSQGFAIGNRRGGETGGGVGMLLDEGDGNDVYQADIYGQGSSYWYSLGMLVDQGGNDTYTLGQYGQGAGIHLSAGILVDMKGNDTYSNPYGVGLGGAHDWSVGWLIDREGNDFYQGNGQGQGLNFSVGVLLDCAGDDSHSTTDPNSIGYDHNNSIALMLDLEGEKDTYSSPGCENGAFVKRGKHGLCYDVPQGWFPGIDVSTLPTVQDPPPELVKVSHILVAWDGTGVDTQKASRTKEEAHELALEILKKARTKGADWKQLQTDYNEDSGEDGSNAHAVYEATPEARLVKPFKDLALKLGVGQIDICETRYGYHIIKRVE